MKTLSEIARWMFNNINPKPEPLNVEDVLNGKSISLKLYHESFGMLPIVGGSFGKADIRITWNPSSAHGAKEVVILVNIANGEFINIRTDFNREALTRGLIELLEREDI